MQTSAMGSEEELVECTVKQSDLVRELKMARGCVDRGGTIPILGNVLLRAAGECLTICSTDLEVSVSCRCEANVRKAGATTVPAGRLLDYASLLPEADVALKATENWWTSLSCGRSRARFAGMSPESFPELPAIPEAQMDLPSDTVSAMISRAAFAISHESSRFTIDGALLEVVDGFVRLVATDGHRLALVEIESDEAEGKHAAIIASRGLNELVRLCAPLGENGRVRIAFGENHIFFDAGGRVLAVRRRSGNFPDYKKVLPQRDFPEVELTRREVREAVTRVGQFSDEQSRAIRFQFHAGELRLFAASAEVGDAEECVSCEYSGPDLEIGFNGHYLEQFFSAVDREKVRIGVRDSKSSGEFWPAAEDAIRYRYVVMPMRV